MNHNDTLQESDIDLRDYCVKLDKRITLLEDIIARMKSETSGFVLVHSDVWDIMTKNK